MVDFRDLVKDFTGDPACSQGEPREEYDSVTLTIVHNVVPFTVREAVTVLHGSDGNYFASPFDVFLRDVRQRDIADLALLSQLRQGLDRLIKGHDGIRNVQLIEVDTLQSQSFQTAFHGLAKVLGRCIVGPLIWSGAVPSPFGRNHNSGRIWKQSFRDQFLAYVGPIGICGVDELDPQGDSPTQDGERAGPIHRRTPDALAGETHGPKAKAIDRDLFADQHLPGVTSRQLFLVHGFSSNFFSSD